MSYPTLTPTRPLPGTYFQTPAPTAISNGPLFQSRTPPASTAQSQPPQEPTPVLQKVSPAGPKARSETLSTRERAAQTINDTLAHEARYPDLDSYLSQGFSSDFDIPAQSAWAPFHKIKMHSIPDKILDQYNRAQVSTIMGLFAELNHAWVAIDNALYLWDFLHPNPVIVGYESQANCINAVKLAKPRPGVFLPSISQVLIIATTAEIMLMGIGIETVAGGAKQVTLYQTGMAVSVRGLDVHVIETSDSTGRIFFASSTDNDVYELTYQQEEKWFQGRCAKVNQTTSRFSSFAPSFTQALSFSQKETETVEQMVIDDTRNLLYTLSSSSTIRVFHLKPDGTLGLAITKPVIDIYSNIGHIIASNEALNPKVKIVSISPIPTSEASRYHLVATTATGYRIYLSATGSYSWSPAPTGSSPPTSMQAHFVKTPPFDNFASSVSSAMQFQQTASTAKIPIHTLDPTRMAKRFPPGYFFCFTCRDPSQKEDTLFVSAPDSGRIARAHENVVPPKPSESAIWLSLGSKAEDIGLCGMTLTEAASTTAFGNELATQYDQAAAEVAILTNTGVHVIRRRRLVDMFAALVRQGGGEDGLEGDTKNFIRIYGRSETLATALAVTCGQGVEISMDSRLSKVNDPDVLEYARKVFIEYGGRPTMNENVVADNSTPAIDSVVPSPRHSGIALYMSRLLRSIWKKEIAITNQLKGGQLQITPSVEISKLQRIQSDLSALQDFFKNNKNFIEGLSGPEALSRVATKQEEIALQAEHRALHSLVQLLSDTIEGISFVLVLFDERVDEIVAALPEEPRQRFLRLTFEELFSTSKGYEIAKELVKAIVNRNIAKGSNVETVADALRRRCGNFCSAEDVIIFKAQELLKRATEAGANSELSRNLLNESLRLFGEVVESLPMDYLVSAVNSYIENQFFAGAIQLCLSVAEGSDKANLALSWMMDGRKPDDPRASYFAFRKQCYDLISNIVVAVDNLAGSEGGRDGQYSTIGQRRSEAYSVISEATDEVFLTSLYDWYLEQGWSDRLLATKSPFVVTYLVRKSVDDLYHADLLWRYYAQCERYYEAAGVQFQLAQSAFKLPLSRRIEYLGQARANASTFTPDTGRQSRQKLLQDITNLLDVAAIQDDLLQRLRGDDRISKDSKDVILGEIDGPILDLTTLFNRYADAGGYCDICLQIYYVAEHRNMTDIRSTWETLLDQTHQAAAAKDGVRPYEAVIEQVRSLGSRLRMSELVFPIRLLIPMIEQYKLQYQRGVGPPTWVVDLMLDLEVPYETIYTTLEGMFYIDEAPFTGPHKRIIGDDLLYTVQRWYSESVRLGGTVFGTDAMAARISEVLGLIQQDGGLSPEYMPLAQELRLHIDNTIR